MKHETVVLYACAAFCITLCQVLTAEEAAGAKSQPAATMQAPELNAGSVVLRIIEQRNTPVIKKGDPGTENNKYGFEGGCVLKLDGTYHLFTSEMVGNPCWVKMRLGHWTSLDRTQWKREDTLYESSGDPTGKDPRAALWAPMPVFNEKENNWNLFYVAYRAPVGPDSWHGRLWRATSKTPGRAGIGGPYQDAGIIMEPGPQSDPWESVQGTDSIFPFPVAGRWLAFYGSSNASSWWKVGLAEAPTLAGPWQRLSRLNPVTLSGQDTENPVVTRLPNGRYAAVFDTIGHAYAIGYSDSADGIHWSPARQLLLKDSPDFWVKDLRTPLGLIPEPDGSFSLFYTGYGKAAFQGYGCVGWVQVKVEGEAETQPKK